MRQLVAQKEALPQDKQQPSQQVPRIGRSLPPRFNVIFHGLLIHALAYSIFLFYFVSFPFGAVFGKARVIYFKVSNLFILTH